MTEERFEAAMEHMGDIIEKTVDSAANRAWRHKPVRVIAKTISFCTGAGLILGAGLLSKGGSTTGAKVCLFSGCAVIIVGIAELIFIRRK